MKVFFQNNDKNEDGLFGRIERACEGLVYISETDAPVVAFVGPVTDTVTGEMFPAEAGWGDDGPTEERSFTDFFARLTTEKDWFGDREKETAKKFLELQGVLEENLRDRRLYRVGRVCLTIYAAGIDREGRLMGVMTRAVET